MAGTAASLAIRQIYGVNSNVTDNLSFCDDDTVVYVAGHSIVLYNKADRRQRFISQGQDKDVSECITAFASGCGKRYCAVAERGDHPQIHVYDLKTFRKKKTLSSIDTASKEFICMEFSADDQFLLTLTCTPDWALGVWNWNKSKLMATIQVSAAPNAQISRCSFSPIDPTVVCASGKDIIRFYRLTDKELRPLQVDQGEMEYNFISHCWLKNPEDYLVAGTDCGEMLLFRSGEYLATLGCLKNYIADPKHELTEFSASNFPIVSLLPFTFGFIVGTNNGTIFVVRFDDSVADGYHYDSQFVISNRIFFGGEVSAFPVVRMASSPNDESICVLTGDCQMLALDTLTVCDPTVTEQFRYLQSSFHGPKSIQGMDMCARKPLLISCCKDNTLRIWNYKTNELELYKVFLEDMYCATLHPTGLHCAVGFTDKLRVYHILVDDIRVCLEVAIKNCRECKFSKGGNLIAAANGNSIIVLDFYTGEKVADLRGHNGKVKSISWLDSGYQLLSCGIDGAVYLWDLESARRTGEFVHKGTMYTSAAVADDQVFAVGSDRMLSLLDMPDLGNLKLIVAGALLTHVQVSSTKHSFFATTGEVGKPGAVRAYSYPISGDFCAYSEYICMGSQISRVVLTADESFLAMADETGCIVIMELKDKMDRYQRNSSLPTDLTVLDTWTDEVLVTKAELEDRNAAIGDLKQKVDELKMHNEYQLKLKDMNYSEKIKEVTDKFVQELEQAKTQYELLVEDKADCQLEFVDKLKQMGEKHQHDVQATETKYQAQIMEHVEIYQALARDKDAQLERLEDQRRNLVQSHARYVEELTIDFEHKLDEDRHGRMQFQEEKANTVKELAESMRQLEDDVDTEIDHLRRQFEDKLTTARETTLKYKGENGIMKKKSTVLDKELEDQKEEVMLLQTRERDLHGKIKILEKEVSLHKKEIKLRDQSIGEKEKRIYELKKKNQELDKFKFVLDFKIRELKKQIEPRQLEIMAMKDKIKEMDGELDKFHNMNSNLDAMIGTLRGRIDDLQDENRNTRIKAKQQENSITAFKSDIQGAVAHILSATDLKTAVEHLVAVHGQSGAMKPRIDKDVEQEYSRHKEFLKRSVAQLQNALGDETNAHTQTNCTLMNDNMKIIEDINKQRAANNLLKQAVQAHVGRVRHLAQSQHEASIKAARAGARSAGPHRPRGSTADQAIKSGVNSHLDHHAQYAPRPPGTAPSGIDRDYNTQSRSRDANGNSMEQDPLLILDRNRFRIAALKGAIQELESRVGMQKAYSREVFPPMDGVSNNAGAIVSATSGGAGRSASASRPSSRTGSVQGGQDLLVPQQPETQPTSSSRHGSRSGSLSGSRRGSRSFVDGIAAIPSIAVASETAGEPSPVPQQQLGDAFAQLPLTARDEPESDSAAVNTVYDDNDEQLLV